MASPRLDSILLPAFFLLLILLSYPSPCSSAKCNKDDKKALLAIKSFWGNPYHIINWDDTRGCCVWSGVECDPSTDRVTGFAIFADTNLSGTIPPAIGDLPFLKSLTIRKIPNIVGPIIPDITRLTRLTSLWLDWNGLSGPVPAFLASLPNLDDINLSFNKFSGSIPPELSSLPKLSFLRLDRNQLTGSIPDSFGKFTSGMYLFLSHNNLTGSVPKSLGTIDFTTLDLSRNMLSGDASFLFRPSNTSLDQEIDISRNMFEFDLSRVEFPLQLISLDINHNRIYGTIPQQIVKLELQHLNVTYNRLCGKIPTGGSMSRFDEWSYAHNKCLCGTPLPPCK